MKTSTKREIMAPIFALIIGKILDFIADNVGDVIREVKKEYVSCENDAEVQSAINEFGYEPNAETLTKLNDLLVSKGEDPAKLAKVLVNTAQV